LFSGLGEDFLTASDGRMDAGEFSRRDSFSIIYQEIFLLIFISNYSLSLSLFLSYSLCLLKKEIKEIKQKWDIIHRS